MKISTHSKEYYAFLRLLRLLREESGITQVELAKSLEITQSHLSKFERGELRIDLVQLRKICVVLGSSLPAFVNRWEVELSKKANNRKTK